MLYKEGVIKLEKYYLNNFQENRGDKKSPQKKSFDFKSYKKNTINSLNDVEYFLNNFEKFKHLMKIYKLFK